MAHYKNYVDNKLVHECDNWLEAHDKHLHLYGGENTGLPVYTEINGVPTWGITPEQQKEPKVRRRLAQQRAWYLKKLNQQ